MGGGTSFTKDVPRRGSGGNLLKAVGELNSGVEASGGAVASKSEFCARRHQLKFRLTNGNTPQVGEAIELVAGVPLQLANAHGILGEIESRSAAALSHCLDEDWTMSGTVTAISMATGRGDAVVSGVH